MDGKYDEFISNDALLASIDSLRHKLDEMTAECKKLLDFNTNLIQEKNYFQCLYHQRDTAFDLWQTKYKLLESKYKAIVVAFEETWRDT